MFKRLAAVVAVVALAPEIAFARRLNLQPAVESLDLHEMISIVYRLARARGSEEYAMFEVVTDCETAQKMERAWARHGSDYKLVPQPIIGIPANVEPSPWRHQIGILEQLRNCH